MQSFKIVAYLLLGYFWLVGGGGEEGEGFVDNKGFLSHRQLRFQLGAEAKADQKYW